MRFVLSAILLLLTVFQTAAAQPVTENAVLHSVDSHYPLIAAARANILKARAEYLSSQGAFDPTVSSNFLVSPNGIYQNALAGVQLNIPVPDSGNRIFTGYRIGRGKYPPYDQNRETFNYGEFNVGVEIPFYRDKKIDDRRAKIEKADLSRKISHDNFALTKLQTNLEAVISYWDWVADGTQLLIRMHMLNIAQQRQIALDKSVQSGDAAKIDSIDNQRIIMQRKADLKSYEATFQKSSLLLSLYYRDSTGKPILLKINDVPNLEKLADISINYHNLQNTIQSIVSMHPAIQLLDKQYNIAAVTLKQANNNLLPVLNNKFYVAQDLGGGNPPLNRTTVNYEITFELPINQREAKGQIIAAKNEMIKVENERKMKSEQFTVKINQLITQLMAAQSIIGYTGRESNMASQVEEAENTKYVQGDTNLFILNQRELSTAEAKIRHIEAIRNSYVTLAQLKYAMGEITL